MIHQKRFIYLDFIRGISALAVCAGHLRAVMFQDYAQLNLPALIEKIFYFTTGLGHQAVMIFFVLSGFFVGGSVLTRKDCFKFNYYLLARLSRIWAVLLPALLFTFLIDHIIHAFFPLMLRGEYHSLLNSGPDAAYSSSFITFVGNLTFLQNIFTPVFGSNSPLWSLTNEFWYYILCPIVMMTFGLILCSHLKKILSAIIMFFLFVAFYKYNLLQGFIIWFLGVGVYYIYKTKKTKSNLWTVPFSIILFIGSLLESKLLIIQNAIHIPSDFLIAVCFSLLLISIKGFQIPKSFQKGFIWISNFFSKISYTLYLFHFPIVLLIYCLYFTKGQNTLNSVSFLQYILCLVAIVVMSYMFWWLFERKTPNVRKILKPYFTESN